MSDQCYDAQPQEPEWDKFSTPELLREKNPVHAFESWALESVANLARQLLVDRAFLHARLEAAEAVVDRYQTALRTIRGPEDSGPFIEVYREAHGGYMGLQAIATAALAPDTPTPEDES